MLSEMDPMMVGGVAGATLLVAAVLAFVVKKMKKAPAPAAPAPAPAAEKPKRASRATKSPAKEKPSPSPAKKSPSPKPLSKKAQAELERLKFASPGKASSGKGSRKRA